MFAGVLTEESPAWQLELYLVATVGASNLTYVRGGDAHAARRLLDGDPCAGLGTSAGGTAAMMPGQLKSGVVEAYRYELGIKRMYEELAAHYGTTILSARPATPTKEPQVERRWTREWRRSVPDQ